MISYITALLRMTDTLPAADPAAMASAAGIDDAIWTGPALLPSTVEASYANSLWFAGIAALSFLAFIALIRAARRPQAASSDSYGGLIILSALVAMAMTVGFAGRLHKIPYHAREAYVVTPTRIVVLGVKGERNDYPASGIVRVSQSADGSVVVKLSDKTELVLEAMEKQKLHAAVNRLIETAGRGADVIRESLG